MLNPKWTVILFLAALGPLLVGCNNSGSPKDRPSTTASAPLKDARTLEGSKGSFLVAFSPDGKRIAAASGDEVRIWDTASDKLTLTFKLPLGDPYAQGETHSVRAMIFSPDGMRLALAGGDMVFQSGGKYLTSGPIKVWDASTGKEVCGFPKQPRPILKLMYNSDGSRLVTVDDYGKGKVWDASMGKELLLLGENLSAFCVAFGADGLRCAIRTSDKAVKVMNVTTGKDTVTLRGYPEEAIEGEFSAQGTRLALLYQGQTLRVWDVAKAEPVFTISGALGNNTRGGSGTQRMVFSPDGRLLATTHDEHRIKIWDISNGRELHALTGHSDGLAFTPDGKRLATCAFQQGVKLWDLTTSK